MSEWPAWQRWGVWLFSWALYAAAFWLLLARGQVATRVLALLGICVALVLLSYSSRAVLNERVRGIDNRLLRELVPAFLVYMVLMLYVWPLQDRIATVWLKVAVSLLPVLPIAFVVLATIRFVLRCDELERRQHLESAGIAAAVVSVVSMALGFLAASKLIHVDGAIALLLVFPALCVVYGLVCGWIKWRWRGR